MKKRILAYLLVIFSLGIASTSCKKDSVASQASVIAPSLYEVKNWYTIGNPAGTLPAGTRVSTVSNRWLAIHWDRLDTISNGSHPLTSVPIEGTPRNFVNQYQGYRRILASKDENGQIDAVIIEVIHKGNTLSGHQVDQVFRVLYNAFESKKIASIDGFTGFAAFYTKQNYYITGRKYANGIPSSTAAQIEFIPYVASKSATKGGATTLEVNVDCVRVITHAAAECTYECQETVMWSCSVSGGGGYTPPNTNPGTTPGTGSGGGIGSGGGGTGSGGSGVPLSPEQYDEGSGDGYGGYGSTSNPSPTVVTSLNAQIQYNQFALVNPCPKLTDAWRPLVTFTPPPSVINRLNNLSASEKAQIIVIPHGQLAFPADQWQIQTLQNAAGVAINLDYFPIVVDKLPTGYNSPEELLYEMRMNFNGHVDTRLTTFQPHPLLAGEAALWQSSNPLGAIISIGIPGNNGSVITSSYAPDHWTFSTLHEPLNGDHPVSGTREFGFVPNPGGGYTFYVRGADRVDNRFAELFGSFTNPPIPFLAADLTWESWQDKFSKFIRDNGGKASFDLNNNVKNRPDWTEVLKALRNNAPLKTVNC